MSLNVGEIEFGHCGGGVEDFGGFVSEFGDEDGLFAMGPHGGQNCFRPSHEMDPFNVWVSI